MSWVHQKIFAAGGDHIPRNWASFADQTRITSVVHLNPGESQIFRGPAPRSFLWLDLDEEVDAPHETRWLAGRFVQDRIQEGEAVLLHSKAGRHRTRWIYVSFLLLQGKSVSAALRQAEELPWLAPYETDREIWRDFAERVGMEARSRA